MPFEGPIPVPDVQADHEARWRAEVVARTHQMEERLLTLGWCQGGLTNADGARCFVGSLYPVVDVRIPYCAIDRTICLVAQKLTGFEIVLWNDTPGRTKEDVLALIGRVRAEFGG